MRPDPLPPSDETLLGYLLGALSDEESLAIEDQLAKSDALMQRLSDLRSMLEPFADELLEEGNADGTRESNDAQNPSVSLPSNDLSSSFSDASSDLIDDASQEGFREGLIEETMAMIANLDRSKTSDRDVSNTANTPNEAASSGEKVAGPQTSV